MPLSVIIFRLPGMGKYILGSSVIGLAFLTLGGKLGSVTSSIRKMRNKYNNQLIQQKDFN